jgi:cytochrome c2
MADMSPTLFVMFFLALVPQEEKLAPGLVATYRDAAHSVREVVPSPSFHLGPADSIHPAIAVEFTAEWSGVLSVLETGDYAFRCGCDVLVEGRDASRSTIRLTAGTHPIRLRFRRAPGPARLLLEWRSAKFPFEPTPSASLSHRAGDGPGPDEQRIARGRELLEELGCVNCHRSSSPVLARRAGPLLTAIGGRTNPRWLAAWLENPQAFRTDATMPVMLDEAGRRDVASYLGSLVGARPAAGTVARGAAERGKQLFGTIGCAACHRRGHLELQGLGSKRTPGALAAYLRDPARHDPGGRMPSLLLSDEESLQLAAFLLESRNAAFEKPLEAGDAGRGRALVRSAGCLSCHDLEDGARVPDESRAPRLEELRDSGGCLAEEPRGVPRYRLAAPDREVLAAFLRSYRAHPDRAPAPVFRFRADVRVFGCTSCHQLDRQAPSGAPGEAVPPLTDTGAKLRTAWIAEVLGNRRRVQSYLELRMPHYDARATRSLPEGFARASGVEPGDGPAAPPAAREESARGLDLLGMNTRKGGMACVGCHDWGAFKSQGEHAPQLADAVQRLRYDWYVRWMRDPARILSGTSMPAYFRSKPAEEADRAIHTLWAGMSVGERGPLPEGLKAPAGVLGGEERPVAALEPVVIRWDMPEATPAAIAVGLPGRLSYCFDAGEVRLRYAWSGGFVDLSGTLRRKTDENKLTPTAQLLGSVFYRSADFPWRVGSADRLPARRFRGYRLESGNPEFHYTVDGVDVYERIVPTADRGGIVRRLRVARVEQPMWFAVGEAQGAARLHSSLPIAAGRVELPRGRDVRFDLTIEAEDKR